MTLELKTIKKGRHKMANVKTAYGGLSAIMITWMQLFRLSIWVGTSTKKPVHYGVLSWTPVEKAALSVDNGKEVPWREKMQHMQIVYVD